VPSVAVSVLSCNLLLGNEDGYLVPGAGGADSGGIPSAGSSGEGSLEGGAGAGAQGGSAQGGDAEGGGPSAGAPGGGEPNSAGASGAGCGGASDGAEPCVPAACGSCALSHAEAACVDGTCAVARCVGPFRDANQMAADGCETGDVALSGLTLWFMADRGVTQAADGVSSWQDQSGKGLHAVQPAVAQKPRQVALPPGPPMLEFDGADDGLALPAGFAVTSGTSFFGVVEALPNAGCAGILSFSNGDDTDDIEFGRHRPNLLYYEVVGQFVEGAAEAFEVNRRFLIDIVQSSGGAVELRINRVRTGAGSINLPASVTRRQNFVGKDVYDECPTSFHGRIGEILYYDRGVTAAERDRIGAYLLEKWRILP